MSDLSKDQIAAIQSVHKSTCEMIDLEASITQLRRSNAMHICTGIMISLKERKDFLERKFEDVL